MAKEPVIVAAVGVAASHARTGDVGLAKRVEAAMSAAVAKCMEDGEHDPDIQRAAMLAARAEVVNASRQAQNEASAELSKGDDAEGGKDA